MITSSIIDVPKKAGLPDQLGIDAYKNGLTNFINTAQTPLTIAIQGEWGSGKTSLMNSVKHDLCDSSENFQAIWVNTWEYSLLSDEYTTMTNIIQGVIGSVISILEKDKNQNVQALKKKASRFLMSATKSLMKTGANMATAGIAGDAVDALWEESAGQSSLRDLHAELQEQINTCVNKDEKTKGFLFFIDDLDRINPPVAVQILELLKNIFDLENCIFILAIDYDVVVKGLEPKFGKKTSQNEREFRSFFEKIIQLPFTMPVGQYKIDKLILEGLQKINYFESKDIDEATGKSIVEISHQTVGSNPRAIKRLLNSLSLVKNVMFAVEQENKPSDFQQLINIGVFSIQIAYPFIYRALERYPDFENWDEQLLDTFKIDKLDEELKEQLSKNEYFDEEWEQVLYQLCQRESYLSTRAMQISRLLNTLKSLIEDNAKEALGSSEDSSVGDIMSNAIDVASVTSYDDTIEEVKPKEIHKSHFLKGLNNRVSKSLIALAKESGIELQYNQKRVQSNLTYIIQKPKHTYRLDFSIHPGAKDYRIETRYECWYFIKAPHKSFDANLNEPDAVTIKARERFDSTLANLEQLEKELPEYYDFNHGIAKNDHHNTVVMRMNTRLPNAWTFINEEENQKEFANAVVKFLKAVDGIEIVN